MARGRGPANGGNSTNTTNTYIHYAHQEDNVFTDPAGKNSYQVSNTVDFTNDADLVWFTERHVYLFQVHFGAVSGDFDTITSTEVETYSMTEGQQIVHDLTFCPVATRFVCDVTTVDKVDSTWLTTWFDGFYQRETIPSVDVTFWVSGERCVDAKEKLTGLHTAIRETYDACVSLTGWTLVQACILNAVSYCIWCSEEAAPDAAVEACGPWSDSGNDRGESRVDSGTASPTAAGDINVTRSAAEVSVQPRNVGAVDELRGQRQRRSSLLADSVLLDRQFRELVVSPKQSKFFPAATSATYDARRKAAAAEHPATRDSRANDGEKTAAPLKFKRNDPSAVPVGTQRRAPVTASNLIFTAQHSVSSQPFSWNWMGAARRA